jgi:hypothetical protein
VCRGRDGAALRRFRAGYNRGFCFRSSLPTCRFAPSHHDARSENVAVGMSFACHEHVCIYIYMVGMKCLAPDLVPDTLGTSLYIYLLDLGDRSSQNER